MAGPADLAGGRDRLLRSVWWYLDGDLAPAVGGDAGTYWVAIVLRMLAELYLVAVVVRDILFPATTRCASRLTHAPDSTASR